jgi:hypothetical protein
LQGLTGVLTVSERSADKVREALAHEWADLIRPELQHTAMTILLPVVEGKPKDLWVTARAMRGGLSFGERFSFRNLSQEIIRFFQENGWDSFESVRPPTYARELLVRPNWFQTPAAVAADQNEARMAHLREVDRIYAERKEAKDHAQRRRRQFEMDQTTMTGTAAERAAAERARKAAFGFTAAVRTTQSSPKPPPAATDVRGLEFHPGYGWFIRTPEQGE